MQLLLLPLSLPITNDVALAYNASFPYSKEGFTTTAVISAHVPTAAFIVPGVVTDVGAICAFVVAVAMVLPMLVQMLLLLLL